MQAHSSSEEMVLSLSDFFHLCKRAKKTILYSSLFGAGLFTLFVLTRPVEYAVNASFREKGKSGSGNVENNVTTILLGDQNVASNTEVISVMKSDLLLTQVVKELGLQGSVVKREARFTILQRIRDNLLVELAYLTSRESPIIQDSPSAILVKDIHYPGENPVVLRVAFLTEDAFELSNKDPGILVQGMIGTPVVFKNMRFTISRNSSMELTGQEFLLTLRPLPIAVERLANKITVESDKNDKSLLKLKYLTTDRHQGTSVLNALMSGYQQFLKKDQQRILNEQIAYLNTRYKEMKIDLKQIMDEQAAALSSDVVSMGFPNANTAINFFASAQQQYTQNLLAIDLELKHLQQTQLKGSNYYESYTSQKEPTVINGMMSKIRQLRQQADSIEMALLENQPVSSYQEHDEFHGIDLDTVKELYINYSKDLSGIQAEILQKEFIVNQMKDPAFEISSLSTVLADPVSQYMIQEATKLSLHVHDQNNRSAKEQERLRDELNLQKDFLAMHLNHSALLLQLRQKLLKEKIYVLQSTALGLIQEEIAILQKHFGDHIKTRMEHLTQERSVLEAHQRQLQEEMTKLPSKWAAEKLVDQQMELNAMLFEEITRLVESKNTSTNLEVIQSAPLDMAYPPLLPKRPAMLLFAIAGAIFGAIISMGFVLARSVGKGVAVTADNLKLAQQLVLGSLSSHYHANAKKPLPDHDLEVLRRIVTFLEMEKKEVGKRALLLIDDGENYSEDLATLLSKRGLKVLLLPLYFDQAHPSSQQPGLLQYLEEQAEWPKILTDQDYDTICPGGICRYANELLGKDPFMHLLNNLEKDYDWVIATSKARVNSAEAETLLHLFPRSIISVSDLTWKQLSPCLDNTSRLAFIMNE